MENGDIAKNIQSHVSLSEKTFARSLNNSTHLIIRKLLNSVLKQGAKHQQIYSGVTRETSKDLLRCLRTRHAHVRRCKDSAKDRAPWRKTFF